ncbi:glycosyltransferase family 2 protein [Microbulbifer sp. HZ11]|uniref:glycosyltransferase n=1 Tax=Microbulbifer sp. HZ11 TaxID=1453501 RepID=UPI0018CC4317|nr:glycosyltransferase [Microbulbifer sp. HZ11]
MTVVVPVCDHWHVIPGLLDCLEKQTLPQDEFQVLLIENGSNEFSPPKIRARNVTILTCEKLGSYAARNLGVVAAQGEWLVFTDADCLPESDWLENIRHHVGHCHDELQFFAGRISVVYQTSPPNYCEIYDVLKGIPQRRYVKQGYAATANLVVHKKLFDQLDGFSEHAFSGGDVDFCRRAVSSGAQLNYLHQAVVKHRARTTWKEIATKARRIKGGKFRTPSGRGRVLTIARSLMPPAIAVYRFARDNRYSWRYRGVAISIQLGLWIVELKELLRLSFNREAERR